MDSFHIRSHSARGQFTDWDVVRVRGARMQPLPEGSSASGPRPCSTSSLGTGPALTPSLLWALGWGWRETQSSPQRLQGHQGHHQGESRQTGQSSPQGDTVHKLGHWFPIMGKNYYSINHNRKMGCFRKKMGPILTSKTKKILATFTVKIRKKLKLNTEL